MQKVTIGVYPNPASDPGVLEAGQIQGHGSFTRGSQLRFRILPPTHQIQRLKNPGVFPFAAAKHNATETDFRRR